MRVNSDSYEQPDTNATPEEQEFLRGDQRVELNAFTSADLILWIEEKLDEHGIEKVVPNDETLVDAYRRAYQMAELNHRIVGMKDEVNKVATQAEIPDDIRDQVDSALEDEPHRSWDDVLAEIVEGQVDSDGKASFLNLSDGANFTNWAAVVSETQTFRRRQHRSIGGPDVRRVPFYTM